MAIKEAKGFELRALEDLLRSIKIKYKREITGKLGKLDVQKRRQYPNYNISYVFEDEPVAIYISFKGIKSDKGVLIQDERDYEEIIKELSADGALIRGDASCAESTKMRKIAQEIGDYLKVEFIANPLSSPSSYHFSKGVTSLKEVIPAVCSVTMARYTLKRVYDSDMGLLRLYMNQAISELQKES